LVASKILWTVQMTDTATQRIGVSRAETALDRR
jgi:hypothetical protein